MTCQLGALGAAFVLVLAAGCRRDEVTHYRVAKEPPASDSAGLMPASMSSSPSPPGMAGDVPPPPPPSGDARLTWTLPRGWTQRLQGGMRYATITAPAEGRLDVSVVVLPGPAGGELANVNRWRNQIGLPPLDAAGMAAARKAIAAKAGAVSLYDFTSDGQKKSRVVAGLAEVGGSTWFVKMTGDEQPVATARAEFIRLLESLRRDDAQ
ncbi:MAG TPA: hypothetical protein VF341_05640 [Anaeromyxobacteraceae bacterium]